jgi:two-component system, response regulator PdtaR
VVFSRDDNSGAVKGPSGAARVLIVEDDHLVGSEMEGALEHAGFSVVGIGTSAEEVLQLAAEHRPQLVVMDIRLKGQRDGIDAAIDLFSLYGIRCVFATAHHTAETRKRAEPASPLAWIAKPYTMASLVAAVRKALNDIKEQ